ncbi:MAG: alpha/beta fold hydrolase [Myxococcota bacterium]
MSRVHAGLLTIVVALLAIGSAAAAGRAYREVDFPTAGGIHAHADVYPAEGEGGTVIVLFHQAGWSRGEYREIAPKLVSLGYRVMAVDQRAGKAVNGVRNETNRRAQRKRMATRYLDAYVDLLAALDYAHHTLQAEQVIVWGSSYSASLVFRLAAEQSERVAAVLSFSPGEYFRGQGTEFIQGYAKTVNVPVFVTSAKAEREKAKPIYDAVPAEKKILFTPASLGQHGSRALWERWGDNDVYWAAVTGFLTEYAPAAGNK